MFTPVPSNDQFTSTVLLNQPDSTTCMKGIIFDGSYHLDGEYFYQFVVHGKWLTTTLVDYGLSGAPGTKVRYGKVQGPKCDCGNTLGSRLFNFIKFRRNQEVRKAAQTCTVDEPVMVSEVKLLGKCNEGLRHFENVGVDQRFLGFN